MYVVDTVSSVQDFLCELEMKLHTKYTSTYWKLSFHHVIAGVCTQQTSSMSYMHETSHGHRDRVHEPAC